MQWGIEQVAAVVVAPPPSSPPATGGEEVQGTFAGLMQQEIGNLNASVGAAESAMRDLAAGKPVQLHEVMISLERARISVQTFLQVRNKLIESYQDLMRMQL